MEFSFACKNIPSAAHFQRIQIIRADWDCWHSFKCIYRRICYSLFHSTCEFLVLVLHNVSICLLRILFTHISNATIHSYSLARFFLLAPICAARYLSIIAPIFHIFFSFWIPNTTWVCFSDFFIACNREKTQKTRNVRANKCRRENITRIMQNRTRVDKIVFIANKSIRQSLSQHAK